MGWQQLHLQLHSQAVEAISDTLHELGAVAVTLSDAEDNPIFEPPVGTTPLWEHTQVTGLFEEGADLDAVVEKLRRRYGAEAVVQWQCEALPEQDWERSWMDSFQPMRFGERLWIVPSWHQAPDPEGANIALDPGLAFGTGTHPTTALCLEWLDAHPPHDLEVVDFGCGSGVLAIAALVLGARHVVGVDTDPQALQASRANAEQNSCAERLELFLPKQTPTLQCDLLLANILANPLQELAAYLAAMVRPGGHIVLSGILREQAEGLRQTYGQWFTMAPAVGKEEWVRLEGTKK